MYDSWHRHDLSGRGRLIVVLEKTVHAAAAGETLSRRIYLPPEKHILVFEGPVDLDVAYSYAPDAVKRVRQLLAERYSFERRQGRSKAFLY